MNPPLSAAELNAIIASSPFNSWLGQTVTRVGDEGIEIAVRWRDEFIGGARTRHAHGGIFTALINAAGCYALTARLGRTVPTVDLRCDFLRPAPPGDLVVAARVVKQGRTLGIADVTIFDGGGNTLASGRAVYALGN